MQQEDQNDKKRSSSEEQRKTVQCKLVNEGLGGCTAESEIGTNSRRAISNWLEVKVL